MPPVAVWKVLLLNDYKRYYNGEDVASIMAYLNKHNLDETSVFLKAGWFYGVSIYITHNNGKRVNWKKIPLKDKPKPSAELIKFYTS